MNIMKTPDSEECRLDEMTLFQPGIFTYSVSVSPGVYSGFYPSCPKLNKKIIL